MVAPKQGSGHGQIARKISGLWTKFRGNASHYLGSNLLCDILESLSHRVHGALALEDDRAIWAAPHVDIGLGSLADVPQDIPDRLLELTWRKHLRRGETKLFDMLSRQGHDFGTVRGTEARRT